MRHVSQAYCTSRSGANDILMRHMEEGLIDESAIRDLRQDAMFFSGILKDCGKKLTTSNRRMPKSSAVKNSAEDMLRRLSAQVDEFASDIRKATAEDDVSALYEMKNSLVGSVHEFMGVVGYAAVLSHWQSPAIDQSIVDEVGTLRGKIIAHYNDYTRDQHVLGTEFEKRYRNEYIRVPRIIPVYTYATSSGMAAVATAALMILGETREDAAILLGTSCYFETKQLVKKMFGGRVKDVDFSDLTAVSRAIEEYSPAAVFADTIGNEPDMCIVEGQDLIQAMSFSNARKKYVVLDTSASAYMREPMSGISLPKNLMLIGVESQNKLLQYGFDRVTAGVVWGTGFEAMRLYDYRDHAGTVCPDASLASLPTPNARLAGLHIRRIERNTKLLVEYLRNDAVLRQKNVRIVYPGSHGFNGVYCMLSFAERPFRTFEGYIKRVMKRANRENVPLVHGTSFGFHTTRLYTVAKNTLYERPFLRISPGTETEEQIVRIGKLLSTTM